MSQDIEESVLRSVSSTRAAREKLAQDVEKFLSKGGEVAEIPEGMTGISGPISIKDINRSMWARKIDAEGGSNDKP